MEIIIGGIVFLYGIVLGSFYNVIIYRLPLDMSIAKGRSMCTSCNTTLKAIDLVPVFSWLALRGKCRYCGSKISLRYPLVELATGVLFLIAYWSFGFGWALVLYCSFYSMLLITALIDMDHMIICDYVLYGFSLISLVCMVWLKYPWKDHLFGFGLGFGFYLLIYLVARAVYKREAFGFGDVMLMGAIGMVLGFRDTLITSILSFYIAIIVIALLKIFGKRFQLRQEIPFGPYICMAAFIVSLYGEKITDFYFRLMY